MLNKNTKDQFIRLKSDLSRKRFRVTKNLCTDPWNPEQKSVREIKYIFRDILQIVCDIFRATQRCLSLFLVSTTFSQKDECIFDVVTF